MEPSMIPEVYERITLPFLGLGAMAIVIAVLLPAFAILGFMTGRGNRNRKIASGEEVDLRAGEASLGAIMALLGLLLAFSFGSALSLLESRKLDVIAEANTIVTVEGSGLMIHVAYRLAHSGEEGIASISVEATA